MHSDFWATEIKEDESGKKIIKIKDLAYNLEAVAEVMGNEIFIKTAGKLELEPEECIVIEDSPAGIKAAFDGGMYGIHVEDLKEADENILKCCKANFKNLIEIKTYIKEEVLK